MDNSLTTDLAVLNHALMRIGAGTIASLSADDDRARAAAEIYEPVIRSALVEERWRFNMALAKLVRLVDAPLERFSAAYAMPADALALHRVAVRNTPIRWDRIGSSILCNAEPADDVIATYSWRAPEIQWPADFTAYAAALLASALAGALTRDGSLVVALRQEAELAAAQAAGRSAQNRTPDRIDTGRFLRERLRR